MQTFVLWTIQRVCRQYRIPTRARARVGALYCPHYRTPQHASASLKGPRKISIQFLELHVGFSIVDNTELPNMRRPP